MAINFSNLQNAEVGVLSIEALYQYLIDLRVVNRHLAVNCEDDIVTATH